MSGDVRQNSILALVNLWGDGEMVKWWDGHDRLPRMNDEADSRSSRSTAMIWFFSK